MDSIWYKKIENKITEENEKLHKKDFKFYNVDMFLALSKKIDELSENCVSCKHLKPTIEEIAENLSDYLKGEIKSRRNFEKKLNQINLHIRQIHKIYPAQFYLYTYSFVGIIAGLIIGLACILLFGYQYIKAGVFIGFISGLIMGRILGKIKDRKLKREGRSLE